MLTDPSELPGYIRDRLEKVIASTGCRVAIEEAEIMEFDSEVVYAHPGSPLHHIRYSSSFRDHRNHFILSSLEKIRRFFAAPLEQRYLPLVDQNGRLPADEELQLFIRSPSAASSALLGMSNQLYVGLARQLLSFPLDLRVEQELHEQVPEHRALQHAYLARQVADFEEHFSPQIAAFSPPKAYAASSAMNCAFAEFCSRLTGERPCRGVRFSPHRDRGRRLLELLQKVAEPGHVGDRQAQDAWAEELGLDGTYDWVQVSEG